MVQTDPLVQKSHLVDLFYGFYAGLFCVSTILKIYPAALPHIVAKIYYIDHGSRFTVLACAQVKDRSDTKVWKDAIFAGTLSVRQRSN